MDVLSLTSHHALKALIYLAQREKDLPLTGAQIAEATGIPPKYLSKILGDLVRSGVLDSAKGKRGGFSFSKPTAETNLMEVLAPFEHMVQKRCPFANQECSDADPCGAHAQWKSVLNNFRDFLQKTSVYEVSLKQSQLGRSLPVKPMAGTRGRKRKSAKAGS